MKLKNINNYVLKIIFSYLNTTKSLNIIKYNKNIQNKLEITKFTYLKQLFMSIITPTLLRDTTILLKNKIIDEKLLEKLKSDWKNETTEIINEEQFFHLNEVNSKSEQNCINILNISVKDQNKLKNNIQNLIELNISDIKNLEIPCSILINLETLSLRNIYKIKFLNNELNISLNKLKNLYIDNISFDENNKIKININGLNYLDLRLIEQDGFDKESGYNNYGNKAGFYKENTIEYLIKFFNFEFLSIFPIDTKKYVSQTEEYEDYDDYEEDDPFTVEKFRELKNICLNPEGFFKNKRVLKCKYFNLQILYGYFRKSGMYIDSEQFLYEYTFSKTKGDKYLFKTKQTNFQNCNGKLVDSINEEKRYCDNSNYNKYYYIDNKLDILENDISQKDYYNYEKINNISIGSNESSDDNFFLDNFNENKNCVEVISFEYLFLNDENALLNKLKKFQKLKCFYVEYGCIFTKNQQIIDLFIILSSFKFLWSIEIKFEIEIKLSENEINKINSMFNGISLEENNKCSIIKWYNDKLKLTDFKNMKN